MDAFLAAYGTPLLIVIGMMMLGLIIWLTRPTCPKCRSGNIRTLGVTVVGEKQKTEQMVHYQTITDPMSGESVRKRRVQQMLITEQHVRTDKACNDCAFEWEKTVKKIKRKRGSYIE